MKVSIITTCFNRIGSIKNTIESVLSQDYADIEYIIIDAQSTDGSVEVIKSYASKIAHFVSEPDTGIYNGINKGLQLATGELIGLLHSDDIFYSSDTISQIVKEAQRTSADIVYANGLFVRADNVNYVVRDWVSGGYYRERIRKGWLPLHTTVFARKSVYNSVGPYNEEYRISADTEWLIRAFYESDFRIAYLNKYVVCMRMGGASTNMRTMLHKWDEDMRIYKSHHIPQYISVSLKVLSKIPQFIKAKVKNFSNKYKTI